MTIILHVLHVRDDHDDHRAITAHLLLRKVFKPVSHLIFPVYILDLLGIWIQIIGKDKVYSLSPLRFLSILGFGKYIKVFMRRNWKVPWHTVTTSRM